MSRRPPTRRIWPWAVAAASVTIAVGATLGFPDESRAWPLLNTPAIIALVVVGAVLIVRRPANPIGMLLLAAGGLMSVTDALAWSALAGPVSQDGVSSAALIGILAMTSYTISIVIVLVWVPLIFPDGRLISARWRWFVGLTIVAGLVDSIVVLPTPGPVLITGVDNPFAVPGLDPLVSILHWFSIAAGVVGIVAAASSLWVRFRRGRQVERQQLKWLVAVAALGAIVLPISWILPYGTPADVLNGVGLVIFAAVPVVIGMAILRYRLYEIDRIISRTISWAIVTGALLATFVALVLGLQSILVQFTGGGTLAVAGSTLIVAALFGPVRSGVQRAVDSRFDRARYVGDAQAVAFAERLRDEVDLAMIEQDFLTTIDETLRPTRSALWLRGGQWLSVATIER
jgi:hypothetical protein